MEMADVLIFSAAGAPESPVCAVSIFHAGLSAGELLEGGNIGIQISLGAAACRAVCLLRRALFAWTIVIAAAWFAFEKLFR